MLQLLIVLVTLVFDKLEYFPCSSIKFHSTFSPLVICFLPAVAWYLPVWEPLIYAENKLLLRENLDA